MQTLYHWHITGNKNLLTKRDRLQYIFNCFNLNSRIIVFASYFKTISSCSSFRDFNFKNKLMTSLIPNYKIIREIGHGCFGYVFQAYDVTNDEIVAIKRIHKVSSRISREFEMLLKTHGF